MTRKRWFWIGGGVLVIAVVAIALLGFLGQLPWQASDRYDDPAGRFSMEIGPAWEEVETGDAAYTQFRIEEPPMDFYVFDAKVDTIEAAFAQAFEHLGFDRALIAAGSGGSIGDWEVLAIEDAAGLAYGLAGQAVKETVFVMIVKAREPGTSPTHPSVVRALMTATFAGKEEVVIEGYPDVETLVQAEVNRLTGSVSTAVIHDGEIVYTYVYGQANPVEGLIADTETIYPWGSMTKIVTAVALMQLQERGWVDLDAWPGEYIPEFPEHWNVTVRQLLTHEACLPDSDRMITEWTALGDAPFPPLAEVFTAYVNDYPDLVCEPGATAQYSNPNYLALARIVEEISGQDYETYVVEHILTPLTMTSTHFQLLEEDTRYAKLQLKATQTEGLIAALNEYKGPGQEAYVLYAGDPYDTLADFRVLPPWGGLRSTPGDVAKFLQMHMNGGTYAGHQVLQPETAALMQEVQTGNDGSPLLMGLGWWHGKDDFGVFYEHGGGVKGGECLMRFYPDLDLGIVVMGNVVGYKPDRMVMSLASAWELEKE